MVKNDHTDHREAPWHTARYTPEFKQQAVQLSQQPDNINQGIANDLGINQSVLSSWIKAAKEPCSLAFPGQGVARLEGTDSAVLLHAASLTRDFRKRSIE